MSSHPSSLVDQPSSNNATEPLGPHPTLGHLRQHCRIALTSDCGRPLRQRVIQSVTNRCSSDEFAPNDCEQERCRQPRLGKLRGASEQVELLDVLRPRRFRPESNGEVEVVGEEIAMGRSHLFLVGQPNSTQTKIQASHMPTLPDAARTRLRISTLRMVDGAGADQYL